MICNVIATGSTGNAVLLERCVLIDCGVPYKALAPYVRMFGLVLLTHVHGDHFNRATIRRLAQDRPLLRFGCCEWMVPELLAEGVPACRIDVYRPPANVYNYGDVLVEPFFLPHDVENCGYKIWIGREASVYATDTATLEGIEARGFDLYMIEANYTQDELEARIQRKAEAGEFIYEYRAAASHLSREQADEWLARNAGPNSEIIYLHGHKEG